MINQEFFTKDEQTILRSLPSRFEWIARDADGTLCIYKDIPKRKGIEFICSNPYSEFAGMELFENIFKGVTFENSPIRFRGETLDTVERSYLKAVLRPFRKRIAYIKKLNAEYEGLQYIRVMLENSDWLSFPVFQAGTMYKGMKIGKKYTLEELEIKY